MEGQRRENIVIFPFMSQGHIIPFLALALQIEQKGYQITFINTPLNIKNLRRTLPPATTIRLLEIPFNPADHGLPPDGESTDDLPYDLIFRLLQASTSLEPAFRTLLSDLVHGGDPPLAVIADFFFGWTTAVAHEFRVFHAIFSSTGGFGLACYCSMWLNLPHQKRDSVEFTLPDFPESGQFHITQLTASLLAADGTDPWSIFQQTNIPLLAKSDGFLFNTILEIDKIGLNYFNRKLHRPVWPVGPILLSETNRVKDEDTISPELCIEWLDTKKPNSVLYISFGSQNTITASQMMQLAKALAAGGKDFIWVLQPPLGFDKNSEFKPEEWLPEGFKQQIYDQNRGLILLKWAPQLEILSHKSTAAFLSHCGWNSVLESLSRGVPLIGWPMAAEQFYNVKFLVEDLGVCVEVARGTNFEVRCEDFMEKINLVMGEENENIDSRGVKIRRKACEVKEMIREAVRDGEGLKGSSIKAMEDFLDAALLMKERRENGNGSN
ncbi:hypothetical protein LguiB_001519 [Lonicera macranthoides]